MLPNPRGHNYIRVLNRMLGSGEIPAVPGALGRVEVGHEEGCGIYRDARCDCRPEIRFRLVDPIAVSLN